MFLNLFLFAVALLQAWTRNETTSVEKFHLTAPSFDILSFAFNTWIIVAHFGLYCFGSWYVNDIIYYQLYSDQFPLQLMLHAITHCKSDMHEFTRYEQYQLIDLIIYESIT